jgi:hypothetical protein
MIQDNFATIILHTITGFRNFKNFFKCILYMQDEAIFIASLFHLLIIVSFVFPLLISFSHTMTTRTITIF